MNDVYFKASLQNTLNPEVGTFDNVDNKEGTFTLEDGEYYLTNNTSTSYGVYYTTETINSVGFTIEFDINYGVGEFGWCLLFSKNNHTYWHGFGTYNGNLQYRGQTLPDYNLIASPNTWLHVKCIFDYDHNQNYVDIYIDNVKVNNFTISNDYGIKYIDILGNRTGWVPHAKIKNIIIYKNKEHYLDTNGLTSLWSKIKSLFATKSELTSKANDSDVVHKSGDETIAGTKTFVGGSDSGLTALNSSTKHSLLFGIGSTGVNRGIYDNKNTRWSIYLNDTDYIMTQCPTPPAGDSSNKLATTGWVHNELDSTCVQTAAVDQTIAGTKTFSKPIVGSVTGSSGSCTGNSATATKLATARTIALSGAVTGTATAFDGSGNITIPVTALSPSAIRAQWYAAYPDGAEAHNSMWGGRDITVAFNHGTVSANIANGTFRDIFPGDYITKQVTISGTAYTVNWVIADCDYWWHKGDQNNGMETHHVVIVPQAPIFNARMNSTNTTEGGYKGSEMYKNIIPACATGIVNAFGSSHILTFQDGITTIVDTSLTPSNNPYWTGATVWWGEWRSVQCNLMCEAMVYDGVRTASSASDNIMVTRQMSAFRLSERLINYNRQNYWLRDVVSSLGFAVVHGYGLAGTGDASTVFGVRPFALLR